MANVHVHLRIAKPRVHPVKRVKRWADRALLGIVMGVAAWAIERAVVRGTKHANAEPAPARSG